MKLNLMHLTAIIGLFLMSCGGGATEKSVENNVLQQDTTSIVEQETPVPSVEAQKTEEVPSSAEELKKEAEAVDKDVDDILKGL